MTISRRGFLAGAAAAVVGLGARRAAAAPAPNHIYTAASIVGSPVSRAIQVYVRAASNGLVRLLGWSGPAVGAPRAVTGWRSTGALGVARLWLPLPMDQPITYRAQLQASTGGPILSAPLQTLAPLVPDPVTFAYGSCQLVPSSGFIGSAKAIARAATKNPMFFAMIGDMGYGDHTTYVGAANQFGRFMALPDVQTILRRTHFIGMQDDHDYGLDDQYGAQYRSHPEGRRAYIDLVPGTRPLPGPAYRSWRISDVLFCLLDCRWYSDPKQGPYENGAWRSMLGRTQREWLYQTVRSQQARVNVILSPVSFNSPAVGYPYGNAERSEIANRLSQAPGTTIICGGDIHASSYGRGPGRLHTFTACPLYQNVHHRPLFTESLWSEGGAGGVTPAEQGFDVFGHISIDTTAGAMNLQVIEDNGTVRFATTVPV